MTGWQRLPSQEVVLRSCRQLSIWVFQVSWVEKSVGVTSLLVSELQSEDQFSQRGCRVAELVRVVRARRRGITVERDGMMGGRNMMGVDSVAGAASFGFCGGRPYMK